MEPYFPFTQADFAHLDPETAYAVEYIVNTRDFQRGIADVRKQSGVSTPLKFDRKKLPPHHEMSLYPELHRHFAPEDPRASDPDRPASWLDVEFFEPNPIITPVVNSYLDGIGKQDNLWFFLLFSYAKFGAIPHVTVGRGIRKQEAQPTQIADLPTLYKEAEQLSDQGKSYEEVYVSLELGAKEWTFITGSSDIEAYSERGDVVVRIKPSASEQLIRDVIAATKKYRAFFRKKGNYGSKNAPRPSILKEMIVMKDHGAEDGEIAAHLKRKYRISRSATAIRQDIARARHMGL